MSACETTSVDTHPLAEARAASEPVEKKSIEPDNPPFVIPQPGNARIQECMAQAGEIF